ncbi:MAG TPA: energy transducer TonB [Bryobacteraceae bacterium]|nr:energy transducer TonB [Bryobacteraceae bacterium]
MPELELLPARKPLSARHFIAMAIGSIAVHIAAAAFFFSLPEVIPPPRSIVIRSDLHKAVRIYAPKPFEPTQKAPNLSKVVRPELDVRSEVEAPQSQAPRYRPPQPAPGPVAPPVPAPAPPIIEPPKTQVATAQPPPAPPTVAPPPNPNGSTAQAPPPPESSKPKIAFENVAPPKPVQVNGIPDPRLLMQRAAIDSRAAQEAPRSTGGGGVTVGDTADDLSDLPRLSQTQSRGRMGSNLQLLSDSTGFDFKPYLMQVLASVRRNWMSVIPESVKMGRRGQVLIQFIIDRHGAVPKLVIATSSGTEAFDRAAVAGVSMSNPFPPLPAEFKGDQIRVQLAFSYNAPR